MSADPLKSLGYWSGKEIALEGALPIAIAGYAFWKISGLMGAVAMGKPLTQLETFVLLGALVALVSWAVSRNSHGSKVNLVSRYSASQQPCSDEINKSTCFC